MRHTSVFKCDWIRGFSLIFSDTIFPPCASDILYKIGVA